MKSSGKRGKYRTLRSKFLFVSIVPTALMLGALSLFGVLITYKMSAFSYSKAMEGQLSGRTAACDNEFERMRDEIVDFPRRSKEVNELFCSDAKEEEKGSILSAKLKEMESSSAYLDKSFFIRSADKMMYSSDEIKEADDSVLNSIPDLFVKKEQYFIYDTSVTESESPLITYIYPVLNEKEEFTGCFVSKISGDHVKTILANASPARKQFWILYITDGSIIYSSNYDYSGKIQNDLKSYYDNEEKLADAIDKEGLFSVSDKVECLPGLYVAYFVSKSEFLDGYTVTIALLFTIAVLSTIIIGLYISIFSKRIVSEVEDIRKGLKNIAKRHYSERLNVHSNDEIGSLTTEINNVISALKYQAEHDSKTDFYNSESFAHKVRETISNDPNTSYALIRTDIDNFSFINDIFDWSVGNEILQKVANILRSLYDENTIFGYLGNDIFVLCVPYQEEDELLGKIIKTSENIKKCEERVQLSVHFGVYRGVKADSDIIVLCDYAGIALKSIKGNVLECYAVYDEKYEAKHQMQKFVESQKLSALENKDFYIMLQPKCDIMTGETVGAEALVRWRDHDTGNIISPGAFIPIFEKSGFIITLDRYVWEETCRTISKWRKCGCKNVPVSVNVSRMHIYSDEFVDYITELVRKYDIPPSMLQLELTESALLEDSEKILLPVMQELKNRGFTILMDDFASGYSSLIALQNLPFDIIKIDKGLIDNINLEYNQKFLSGVVSFLRDIGKEIVVEGVEFDWQKDILKETSCRIVQGFCFARPLMVKDFEIRAFGKEIELKKNSDVENVKSDDIYSEDQFEDNAPAEIKLAIETECDSKEASEKETSEKDKQIT